MTYERPLSLLNIWQWDGTKAHVPTHNNNRNSESKQTLQLTLGTIFITLRQWIDHPVS